MVQQLHQAAEDLVLQSMEAEAGNHGERPQGRIEIQRRKYIRQQLHFPTQQLRRGEAIDQEALLEQWSKDLLHVL
jgi:hypothetical protein